MRRIDFRRLGSDCDSMFVNISSSSSTFTFCVIRRLFLLLFGGGWSSSTCPPEGRRERVFMDDSGFTGDEAFDAGNEL